jgi:hypothetical protein
MLYEMPELRFVGAARTLVLGDRPDKEGPSTGKLYEFDEVSGLYDEEIETVW